MVSTPQREILAMSESRGRTSPYPIDPAVDYDYDISPATRAPFTTPRMDETDTGLRIRRDPSPPPNWFQRRCGEFKVGLRSRIAAEMTEVLKEVSIPQTKVDELVDRLTRSVRERYDNLNYDTKVFIVVGDIIDTIVMYIATGDVGATVYRFLQSVLKIYGMRGMLSSLLSAALVKAVRYWWASSEEGVYIAEAPPEDVTEIATTLWQSLCLISGLKARQPKSLSDGVRGLFAEINSNASKTRGLMNFFKGFITLFTKAYRYISSLIWGASFTENILDHDSELLGRWVDEAQTLINPTHRRSLFTSKMWVARLTSCVTVGNIIQRDIATVKEKLNTSQFVKLWERLQNLHEEVINRGDGYCIRREPVCLWISGAAGLGKTHMANKLMTASMDVCGLVKDAQSIFVYTSGMKHWTGVDGAQVVSFDDFGTVDGERVGEDLANMMQLVSNAKFTPDQAAVADKGKTVNPDFVYINSNESHPQYNELRARDAFFRRRHILIEVAPVSEFGRTYANMEANGALEWVEQHKTEINPYPHLKIRFGSPMSPDGWESWLSWPEFYPEFLRRVQKRYLRSDREYRSRLDELMALEPKNLEQPLEDVLEWIGKRSSVLTALKYEERTTYLEKYFKPIYTCVSELPKKTYSKIASLVKNAFGGEYVAEGPTTSVASAQSELTCTCSPMDIQYLSLVGDVIYSRKSSREEPICGPDCRWTNDPVIYHEAWRQFQHRALKTSIITFMRNKYLKQSQVPSWEDQQRSLHIKHRIEIMSIFHDAKLYFDKLNSEAKFNMQVSLMALGGVAALLGITAWYVGRTPNLPANVPTTKLSSHKSSPVETHYVKAKAASEVTSNTPLKAELYSPSDKKQHVNRVAIQPKQAQQYLAESLNPLHAKLDRNIVTIFLKGKNATTDSDVVSPFRCLGITGRWIVMLRHYAYVIDRTVKRSVQYYGHTSAAAVEIKWPDLKRIQIADSEIVLIELPKNIHVFPDLRKWIMSEKEATRLTSTVWAYESSLGEAPKLYELKATVQNEVTYKAEDVSFTLPSVLSYPWSSPGRCCTPIFAKFQEWRVVGLHIAGMNGEGIAEPIVRETFAMLGGLSGEMVDPEYLGGTNPMVTLSGEFECEGLVKPTFSAQCAVKSQIEPSKIHGYVEPTTRPAPLSPRHVDGAFSPLVEGCNIHGRPPKDFDEVLLDRAESFLQEDYLQKCIPVRTTVGVLSVEDAVLGFPGLDGYASMELNTSEGFPYVATRPKDASDKRYQFTIEEIAGARVLTKLDPLLESVMKHKTDLRNSGIVPATVFIDCLKDARIKCDKFLVPGKTRIFSISPTDFTVQFRQHFLDILAAQKVHRFDLQHAVGINVHSLEWSKLGRLIQSKGERIICGDYSNFGPRLNSEVVRRVGRVWRNWYAAHEKPNPGAQLHREIMFEEIRHALHLCANILYRPYCGAPSGAPPTVNINNDVNKIYVYMAWLVCWEGYPIMATYVAFKKHCVLFVYGDDLLLNVSDEASEKFNNEFLQSFFAAHDIRYTDELKGDSIRKWGSFAEATFLKGKWIPTVEKPLFFNYGLEVSVVREIANWINHSPDNLAASKQTSCDSLMLAFGHGREFFDKHRNLLLAAWRKRCPGEDLTLYTFDEMVSMRWGYPQATLDLDQLIVAEQAWRADCKRLLGATSDTVSYME